MREEFQTRTIYLKTVAQEATLLELIPTLPIDSENPLQIVIREPIDARTSQQNRYYSAIVGNISDQKYINGKKYSHQIWRHYLKEMFLPEEFDEKLTKVNYKKWLYDPWGSKILVGSTADLKVAGMNEYIEEVIQYAVVNGVILEEP